MGATDAFWQQDSCPFRVTPGEELWRLFSPDGHSRNPERVIRRDGMEIFTFRFRVENPGVGAVQLVEAIRSRTAARCRGSAGSRFMDAIGERFKHVMPLPATGEYRAGFCLAPDDQPFHPREAARTLERAGFPGSVGGLMALAAMEEGDSLLQHGKTFCTFDDLNLYDPREPRMPAHSYDSGTTYRLRAMRDIPVERAYLGRDVLMVGFQPHA